MSPRTNQNTDMESCTSLHVYQMIQIVVSNEMTGCEKQVHESP